MEYVALILAAAVVVAVIFREPLLAAIKKQFGKEADPVKPAEPVKVAEPAPVDPVADYQSKLPASTLAFKGKNGDPKPVGPVDRSGNDLSDGGVRIFVLANGQSQTVTFNRPGKVRIFGSSGTQLKSLTDSETRKATGTIAVFEREFSKAGSYTFSVESVGGSIAAQLR